MALWCRATERSCNACSLQYLQWGRWSRDCQSLWSSPFMLNSHHSWHLLHPSLFLHLHCAILDSGSVQYAECGQKQSTDDLSDCHSLQWNDVGEVFEIQWNCGSMNASPIYPYTRKLLSTFSTQPKCQNRLLIVWHLKCFYGLSLKKYLNRTLQQRLSISEIFFKLSQFRIIKPLMLQITLKEFFFLLVYLNKVLDS